MLYNIVLAERNHYQLLGILQEFKAIGISKQGFVLRLEKAAKKLPALVIETDVPVSVFV